MDLSKVKWVVIIAVVLGVGWILFTESGKDAVYNHYTKNEPGIDAAQDVKDEKGLSRLAELLIRTFRYEDAAEVLDAAIDRYPDGANIYINYYTLARCEENLENYQDAADILIMLRDDDAGSYDSRIPNSDIIDHRVQQLIELHGLQPAPPRGG